MAPAKRCPGLTPPAPDLTGMRIGYAPYDSSLHRPGDRRRFAFYAERRGLKFEIAEPGLNYDIVVLSARADITVWARVARGRTKIIYDLIDSYLEVPRLELRSLLRGPMKFATRETSRLALSYRHAMEEMIRRADAVVCSTPEQKESISALNENVHPILDFHGYLLRTIKHDFRVGDRLNLVWEGQPENLRTLEVIAPALSKLQRDFRFTLHLITDLQYFKVSGRYWPKQTVQLAQKLFTDSYVYQWNESMLSPIATSCDIGIIPLPEDDPLMRAKPENKLLLLWRMAVPTIVSATPAYSRTMAACGLDGACKSTEEWVAALRRYGTDETERQRMAVTGQQYSEAEHGQHRLLSRWDAMFSSVS